MPEPARWRKKPVEVEAMLIPSAASDAPGVSEEVARLARWCGGTATVMLPAYRYQILIPTQEGMMIASAGDYIIRGVQDEFYPCKPDIFEATYEPAEAELVDWGRSERVDGSDSPRCVHTPVAEGWTAVQVRGGSSKRGHTVHASKRAADKDARRLAKTSPNVEVWVCPVIDGKVIWPGGTR